MLLFLSQPPLASPSPSLYPRWDNTPTGGCISASRSSSAHWRLVVSHFSDARITPGSHASPKSPNSSVISTKGGTLHTQQKAFKALLNRSSHLPALTYCSLPLFMYKTWQTNWTTHYLTNKCLMVFHYLPLANAFYPAAKLPTPSHLLQPPKSFTTVSAYIMEPGLAPCPHRFILSQFNFKHFNTKLWV